MPRNKFICDPTSLYHVTARTKNKVPFELPLDMVWNIFCEDLYFLHHAFGVQILNFVLMNNHFHLIIQAPQSNLSNSMKYLLHNTSKTINKRVGNINQLWGGRFFRSRLGSYYYLMNCYKYVYQNPLRANLCQRVENYPYSTLYGILGQSHHLIPTSLETMLFDKDYRFTLDWLNRKPDDEVNMYIKKALSKREFLLPKVNRRTNPWANKLI